MSKKQNHVDQRYRVQVTLDANGTLLRAEERAENLLVAIDKVVPVIDRQIERYKGKLYQERVKTARPSSPTSMKNLLPNW